MTSRDEVIEAARRWIGTRWKHQGRVRGQACDCAGLVIGVARELGLVEVQDVAYGRIPDGRQLAAMCDRYMLPTPVIAPGGVLLMHFGEAPQHLAIVGERPDGDLSLIHAYAQVRRVVEHRFDVTWRRRLVRAYRLPGVA